MARISSGSVTLFFLFDCGSEIARLLRGERDPLSAQERDEVLRHRISYLATDLVIPTWNAAFVFFAGIMR